MNKMLARVGKTGLLKQGLVYIISDGINKSIPFLILPVLANFLLPKEYSVVSNYTVFITILSIFLALGTQSYINSVFYRLEKHQVAEYIGNALFILVFSTAIILCIVFILAPVFLNQFLSVPLQYILLAVFTAAFSIISTIQTSIWRLEKKATLFGLYQISQTLLNVSLSLALIIMLGFTWDGRVIGLVVTGIIYGILSICLLWHNKYIIWKIERRKINELLKFGLPLVPHSLALWVRSAVDRVVVTQICGHDINGQFVAGTQFGLIISFFILSFHNAYIPFLYQKISVKEPSYLESNKRMVVKFTYIYLTGILLMCLIASIASIWFVKGHMNAKYQHAIIYIPWAIAQQFFVAVYLMFVSYLFYVKETKKLAVSTFSCALLQILLCFTLVKYIGAIGASVAGIITVVVNSVWVAALSNKSFPMPWLSRK